MSLIKYETSKYLIGSGYETKTPHNSLAEAQKAFDDIRENTSGNGYIEIHQYTYDTETKQFLNHQRIKTKRVYI